MDEFSPAVYNKSEQSRGGLAYLRPLRSAQLLNQHSLIVILGQAMITGDEELIRRIQSNQGQGHLPLRRDADLMRRG